MARTQPLLSFLGTFLCAMCVLGVQAQPISVHPDNPHYLLYRGEPTVLVTSAEHYGAVVNGDFDYETYLDVLAADGLNYTRIFAGSYFEPPGAFGIEHNTLAPRPEALVTPWPVIENGGGDRQFDLNEWNDAYFVRLREFVREAEERGVIVEVTFFSSIYGDAQWAINPFNPSNNVDGLGPSDRREVHTLRHGAVVDVQKRLVQKIVRELNSFDNVFYEIQNEPWSDNGFVVSRLNPGLPSSDTSWQAVVEYPTDEALAWQREMVGAVREAEAELPRRHLIAQNFVNFGYPVYDVDPRLSILNFHYARPEAVRQNYGWDRVLGLDETGFAGTADSTYRALAWRFMLAGGGLYNNLDYSFTTEQPDGTAVNEAPGGGGPALRDQLRVLKVFLEGIDFVSMRPAPEAVVRSPGALHEALALPGRSYALYFAGKLRGDLVLDVPDGRYDVWWVDVLTGDRLASEERVHGGGALTLAPPEYAYDVALRLEAAE